MSLLNEDPARILQGKEEILSDMFRLEALLHDLQQTKDEQAGFWSLAAHQMQRPIARVNAAVHLFLRSSDPKHAAQITDGLDALSRLLRTLFQYQHWHTSGVSLSKEKQSVERFARDVLTRYKPHETHDVQFRWLCGGAVVAHFDGALVRYALEVLIENALAYTPEGTQVWLGVEQQDARTVTFLVCDTGGGIAPETQKELFTPRQTVSEKGGMGLGLCLAKMVAEAHGGEITCESIVGQGTRFRLTLPLGM